MKAVQRARGALSGCTVRYEDLTADPGAEARRVCDFLGVPWEPEMLAYGEQTVLEKGLRRLEGQDPLGERAGRARPAGTRGDTRSAQADVRELGIPAPRRGARVTAPEAMKIRYMLLHAYGMGGTIRTVINQANAMAAAGHEVEIVSVVRRREQAAVPDRRARPSPALADQREGRPVDSVGRRVWRQDPRQDRARGASSRPPSFTERVERAVIDYVSALNDGILVTTRPALNLISARRTPRRASSGSRRST